MSKTKREARVWRDPETDCWRVIIPITSTSSHEVELYDDGGAQARYIMHSTGPVRELGGAERESIVLSARHHLAEWTS